MDEIRYFSKGNINNNTRGKTKHRVFVLIFVVLFCVLLGMTGCQFGNGLSLGPRDGLFGVPIEFSKREKQPKQSIEGSQEKLLAQEKSATAAGQLTSESIGQQPPRRLNSISKTNAEAGVNLNWLDASDAPSADEWFAGTNTIATSPVTPSDTQNEIMQASYTPRGINANDASRGVVNAAMISEPTANNSTDIASTHRGEQVATANNVPMPLMQDHWVANLELERFRDGKSEKQPESHWRWRHKGIEEILLLPLEHQPNWQALLQQNDPIVQGNILITLAHMGDQRAGRGLVDLANDVSRSRSMRCAAVEALGSLGSTPLETLVQLADTYYDYIDANGNRKGGVPELAVETLYALAAKIPISNEPYFTRPLESRDAKVQLAAVCVWRDNAPKASPDPMQQQQNRTTLPDQMIMCCGDSNTAMQEAALLAIARWQHPRAMQCLDLGLRSPKATVRCAAIRGLAIMQTNEATTLLLSQANDQSAAIRAEVVTAMGQLGLLDNVYQASDDPGWEVRKAVARELAKSDNAKSHAIAQKYLNDPSTQVQTTTLESLRNWHPASTAPLLFEAMGGNALETRNLATEMLGRYWEPARQYVPNGRTETRKPYYAQLTAQFQHDLQSGILQANIASMINGDALPQTQANKQTLVAEQSQRMPLNESQKPQHVPVASRGDDGRVRALLTQLQQPGTQQEHQNAIDELIKMGPMTLPIFEQIAVTEGRSLPPVVYRQVLPGLDSLFVVSAKLESNDVNQRRAAVPELVGETKFDDVSPMLYKQLADHAVRENDEIVLQRLWDFADQHAAKLAQLDVEWQGSIPQNGATQQYQNMLAMSLATFRKTLRDSSLAHVSPELHRRTCVHLQEYGQAEDVPALLAEINHSSTSVSRPALQALTKLGNIEHATNVRPLLTHSQPLVAVDAALALDRWSDPTGANALERLAVSGDRTTKLAVVQGIKKNLNRKYVPMLIRLLDESGTIRQEALDALPLAAGHDVVPPQEMAYYSVQERVALWKQWNNTGQMF